MTLFCPDSVQEVTHDSIASYLSNILKELQLAEFTPAEHKQMVEMMFAKYLDPSSRAFFLHHFCPLIKRAVEKLFEKTSTPHILELGCGSGTVSILLALLGARVTAIDFDAASISSCRKRQQIYEKQVGALQLEFICGDALSIDYAVLGPFDGIYSLFAFNMMQPTKRLLDRVLPSLNNGGVFMISDGNQLQLYNRYFRKRNCLSPIRMRQELSSRGCLVNALDFDCALPPTAFSTKSLIVLSRLLEHIVLAKPLMRWFGTSYTLVAQTPSS